MSYSMTAAIRTAIRIHPIPETDMHDPERDTRQAPQRSVAMRLGVLPVSLPSKARRRSPSLTIYYHASNGFADDTALVETTAPLIFDAFFRGRAFLGRPAESSACLAGRAAPLMLRRCRAPALPGVEACVGRDRSGAERQWAADS